MSTKNFDKTILVIDDELQIRRLLEITLSANNYNVILSNDGRSGLVNAATHRPSLIILDLGLPDINGHEILKNIRNWYSKPIIILSVRNSEDDIIEALDHGANDYLTKPFRTGELLARIRAALRAADRKPDSMVVKTGPLTIDMANYVVMKNSEHIKLTATEFALLALFVKNLGRVLTHQFILKEIWGYGYIEQTQYLRVFVAQLRKKIEDNPGKPTLLLTDSGIGYRFIEQT